MATLSGAIGVRAAGELVVVAAVPGRLADTRRRLSVVGVDVVKNMKTKSLRMMKMRMKPQLIMIHLFLAKTHSLTRLAHMIVMHLLLASVVVLEGSAVLGNPHAKRLLLRSAHNAASEGAEPQKLRKIRSLQDRLSSPGRGASVHVASDSRDNEGNSINQFTPTLMLLNSLCKVCLILRWLVTGLALSSSKRQSSVAKSLYPSGVAMDSKRSAMTARSVRIAGSHNARHPLPLLSVMCARLSALMA